MLKASYTYYGDEKMEQTIYADVLFLVNFTMDFLTLFVTSSILRRKAGNLRLTLSAALGGAYGVAAVFLKGPLIINIVLNLAVSYLMCLIAFKDKILNCYAVFYGTGCLLGGAMTAFFGFMNENGGLNGASSEGATLQGDIPLGWMALSALIIGGAAIAGGRNAKRSRSLRAVSVEVTYDGGAASFEGITDTGNLLTDPMSGRAVIIVRKKELLSSVPKALSPFFEKDDPASLSDVGAEYVTDIRLVPSVSLGGEKLLIAYSPKRVRVDGRDVSALIASGNEEGYGGYAALVPEILIN